MKIGACKYTLLLNEQGGVQDDMIFMRLSETEFIAVINAGHDITDNVNGQELIADIDRIMACNVRSNFWLSNMVMPGMAQRGGGSVIIVSSIGGLLGSDVLGVYSISKAADLQLARNIAVEWGSRNIRGNCIAPGLVRTADDAHRDDGAGPVEVEVWQLDDAGLGSFLAGVPAPLCLGTVELADG